MKIIRTGGEYAAALRFLNEAPTLDELAEQLKAAEVGPDPRELASSLLAKKRSLGGALKQEGDLLSVLGDKAAQQLAKYVDKLGSATVVEKERLFFTTYLLSNPNYFGTITNVDLPVVFPMKGNTTYEQLTCVGLNTPLDRLEGIIQIKKSTGYSGGMCTSGSREYVRFFVDLHDNGVWHDVGLGSVVVHDINGKKPLCYAVYRDFEPIRKLCSVENVVKVRAILSWNVQPTPGDPNYNPVWDNVMDVEVQIRPRRSIIIDDIFQHIPWDKIEIKDPIGPIIKEIDPKIPIPLPDPPPLSLAAKKELYLRAKVPPHRFAFTEAKMMLASASPTFTNLKASPLSQLGLLAEEIDDILGKLVITDGDTSYEELKCVGLKPEQDLLEAVFTVKKKSGYSGSLCKEGSTEYVAFWGDFFDGAGFTYLGTTSLQVHDLNEVGRTGVQFAVQLKTDLTNYLVSCETGGRLAKIRAILSWEDPPPAGNPNWVPTWGNREECLVQIRPGEGKLAALLEINDVPIDEINPLTGRATGSFVEAAGTFAQAPFGQTLAIVGTIGLGTDFVGGVAPQYKYRVEKKPFGAPDSDYEPITGSFTLRKFQRVNGLLVDCAPGQTICAFTQAPLPAAGEGGESGWYLYHEDLVGPVTQEILSDLLMQWPTSVGMEGRWQLRLHVKDAANVHYYSDTVTVRIDNTAPTTVLTLVSVEVNGVINAAPECGKFPVGCILRGTFSLGDPGTVDPLSFEFQHHRTGSFTISPGGPAGPAAVVSVPANLDFPAVPTTGTAGTWELNTAGMQACGYVLRLNQHDRTIANAGSNTGYYSFDEFGFCLE